MLGEGYGLMGNQDMPLTGLGLKTLALGAMILALLAAGTAAWALPQHNRLNTSQAQRLVREYLQANMPAAHTYEEEQWSKLVTHSQGGAYDYTIRHTYWLQTRHGSKRRMDCIFYIDPDGRISGVERLKKRSGPRPHRHRP